MQIDEAKLSALVISALTGIGLTLFLNQALRDLGTVLAITVPVTLVMGAVLFVFASDNIKTDGDKPPSDKTSKGN